MTDSAHQSPAAETVVLVPGMLSPRITMLPMARRLKKQGYKTYIFQNRYLLKTPVQNAHRLLAQLQAQNNHTVHMLGHSLGGIVIMHTLNLNAQQPINQRIPRGRVVLIASPVRGSDFARWLYTKRGLKLIMSRCVVGGVLDGVEETLDGRETGVICGSARNGMSAMIYKPTQSNDGLVNEVETRLDAAKDSICVPQSHGLMVFSQLCTGLAVQFFRHGRFGA